MSQLISDKTVVKHIVAHCHAHGVRHVIISPGSRNAPLILSFPASKKFTCLSIVDERSAAYFALGLSRSRGCPVALICTSGTAVLNYAPAIAEAYYQQIPLVVISADRPPEFIDQADGQTIRQNGIFNNFIRYQCQLPVGELSDGEKSLTDRLLNEAFRNALGLVKGPVHINVPFNEPLYGQADPGDYSGVRIVPVSSVLDVNETMIKELADELADYRKILFVTGAASPDENLIMLISSLERLGVVIVAENLSNISGQKVFENTDRVLEGFSDGDENFRPDLLITLDFPVLSKKIKQRLRVFSPVAHWHFSNQDVLVDTYQCLTRQIPGDPVKILSSVVQKMKVLPSEYFQLWEEADGKTATLHNEFLDVMPWSDFMAFEILSRYIPSGQEIHLANSTPVRYAQLFKWKENQTFFANRGTSGIDGCVSSAAGSAYPGRQPVTLITGDLAFFYDSNGLWHQYLPDSFRVIVVNNGGGGIFRFIPGPSETSELEPFFEARGDYKCRGIAETFGLQYYAAANRSELQQTLDHFWQDKGGPALLEVFTPGQENGEILKTYFRYLRG